MIDIQKLHPAKCSYMHFDTYCHWCGVYMRKRKDAYVREMEQRGYCCCRKCFSKDPNFRAARKRVMLTNNPFKGKKHSEQTLKHLSEIKIGKPAWNKGTKKPLKKMSNIGLWMAFRDFILNADNCTCKKCKLTFNKPDLDVHHLFSRTKYPELEFDPENCMTLCRPCHRSFHSKYGKYRFTPTNFINWI